MKHRPFHLILLPILLIVGLLAFEFSIVEKGPASDCSPMEQTVGESFEEALKKECSLGSSPQFLNVSFIAEQAFSYLSCHFAVRPLLARHRRMTACRFAPERTAPLRI